MLDICVEALVACRHNNIIDKMFNGKSSEFASYSTLHYPFPKRQILDPSKLKEFADDNFKFVENGRKLSKQVENTVGKGKIACYKQFILFPLCFQKACKRHVKTRACFGKGYFSAYSTRKYSTL